MRKVADMLQNRLKRNQRIFLFFGWVLLLIVTGVVALRLFKHGLRTAYFDDAYVYMRYAKNFLAGRGIAWNPDGTQTFGVTSLLYVLVLALLKSFLPLQDKSLLIMTSVGMSFLGLMLLIINCRLCVRSALLKNFVAMAALVTPLVMFSDNFTYHASSGMDTMFSFFATPC